MLWELLLVTLKLIPLASLSLFPNKAHSELMIFFQTG
jgi:hypothetical protein